MLRRPLHRPARELGQETTQAGTVNAVRQLAPRPDEVPGRGWILADTALLDIAAGVGRSRVGGFPDPLGEEASVPAAALGQLLGCCAGRRRRVRRSVAAVRRLPAGFGAPTPPRAAPPRWLDMKVKDDALGDGGVCCCCGVRSHCSGLWCAAAVRRLPAGSGGPTPPKAGPPRWIDT